MRSKSKCRAVSLAIAMLGVLVPSALVNAQAPSPSETGEGGAPVNAMCPVLTDEPIDPEFTAEYNGITIGLCCRKCVTQFNADPSAFIGNIPELIPASANRADGDHDGHGHGRPKLAAWIGKFHPPATHLPIGLLFGAAIAEALLIVTRRDYFRHAASFCAVLAAFGAVAAATLGWFNGGIALIDEDWVKATHRWLGTGTAALSVLAVIALLRTSRVNDGPASRGVFRWLLFSSALTVGAAGFFGGALVYGIDHYAW